VNTWAEVRGRNQNPTKVCDWKVKTSCKSNLVVPKRKRGKKRQRGIMSKHGTKGGLRGGGGTCSKPLENLQHTCVWPAEGGRDENRKKSEVPKNSKDPPRAKDDEKAAEFGIAGEGEEDKGKEDRKRPKRKKSRAYLGSVIKLRGVSREQGCGGEITPPI